MWFEMIEHFMLRCCWSKIQKLWDFFLKYATKTQQARIRCDLFHIFLPQKHAVDLGRKKFTLALGRWFDRPPRQRHQQFFQILRQMIWKFHLFTGRVPFLVLHILTLFRICSNQWTFKEISNYNYMLRQGYTNSGQETAWLTKFHTVVPNICRSSK